MRSMDAEKCQNSLIVSYIRYLGKNGSAEFLTESSDCRKIMLEFLPWLPLRDGLFTMRQRPTPGVKLNS